MNHYAVTTEDHVFLYLIKADNMNEAITKTSQAIHKAPDCHEDRLIKKEYQDEVTITTWEVPNDDIPNYTLFISELQEE